MRITKMDKQLDKNYWEDFSDEAAATYMESYGEGPGTELRKFLSSLVNDYESVLDVGCGPGWNYDHFKKYGPKVMPYLGIDFSKKFIKVANKRNPGCYVVGDARKLEQPSSSWDVVILQDVLEHTNGYEKPLKEALRVARRRIIITFWHLDDSDDPHINDDGSDTWGAWYDKREWEKYLDDLELHWLHDVIEFNNHTRHIYIIDKEEDGKDTQGDN